LRGWIFPSINRYFAPVKVLRERAMIEQKDVQLCSQGCCIYVNNQPLTEEEYNKGVATGEIGWHTQISCMSERGSKFVIATANKVGFYFGLPSPQQIGSKDGFVYDTKSHRYLRTATAEDARKWLETLESINHRALAPHSPRAQRR
jgi:hypothetical protein